MVKNHTCASPWQTAGNSRWDFPPRPGLGNPLPGPLGLFSWLVLTHFLVNSLRELGLCSCVGSMPQLPFPQPFSKLLSGSPILPTFRQGREISFCCVTAS